MMNANNIKSELSYFNFTRLTYRRTGTEPLPVKEDYWGCDESWENEDQEIVFRGIDTVSREIDRSIWEELTPVNFDTTTYSVAKECIRLLLDQYPPMEREWPSVRELASCLSKVGIDCKKEANGLFRSPSYLISLPGLDYTLCTVKGMKGAYVGFGAFPEFHDHAAIHCSPGDFLSAFSRFHERVRPLIRPMLEDYCNDVRKRMMISQIRKTAKECQ